MHLLLTDLLICPRCGPGHGLLLLADRMEDRRVLEGTLGCANCRERYPVSRGFGDLRPRPAPSLDPGEPVSEEAGAGAFRLAALLGVVEGPGFSLIVGPGARFAPAIAAVVPKLEVVALGEAYAAWPEAAGVSRLAAGPRLPFHTGSLRAVALTGPAAGAMGAVEEGARVLARLGRLVVGDGPPDAEAHVREAGLAILAVDADTLVAARP